MRRHWWVPSALFVLVVVSPALAQAQERFELLVTNETGTMEEQLNRAGAAGYRFAATPGGETAVAERPSLCAQDVLDDSFEAIGPVEEVHALLFPCLRRTQFVADLVRRRHG